MVSEIFFRIKQSDLWLKLFRSDLRNILVCISIALYAFYLQRQYIDLFFESQFLHVNFLEDLTQGRLTAKGFFTVYYEHLFPGYNLILAANYYLFRIWGGFDLIVYMLALIGSIIIFSRVLMSVTSISLGQRNLAIAFAVLTLMSTTNNPQSGMALASSIGVSIMLFCLYRFCLYFSGSSERLSFVALLSIPITIVFFLGGYAIGFVAAVFSIIFIATVHSKSNIYKSKYVFLIVCVSLLIYAAIVIHYGSLTVNRPRGDSFEVLTSGKFFLIMMGSSLLGKATFESYHSLIPYYICGSVLLYWAVAACLYYIKRPPSVASLFFIALLSYAITNLLTVSLFRYKNGLEGGMGQWYNVHTHFIAPIIFVFILVSLAKYENNVLRVFKYLSLCLLVIAGLVGYDADMRKAPHIKIWKQQFLDQTHNMLTSPNEMSDKNNAVNTMLWNYSEAKAGINFLYKNSLWAFKSELPAIDGPSSDGWVMADKKNIIVCPRGTTSVTFDSWRPEGWAPAKVSVSTSNSTSVLNVENTTNVVRVNPDLAFVKISAVAESNPTSTENDPRQLIFIINNIACVENAK